MEKKISLYCSPFRYPGGKACIFPFVSKLFYENHLIGSNYAEPYAGGGGLALKLLFEEYVNNIYINDFDRAIYCVWKQITENTIRFCDWLSDVEVNVETWKYHKAIQSSDAEVDDFDLAKATYFLNRTNISGVIKGGMIGGYNQSGKYKIDARFNRDDLINRIERIARFRNRINISNLDGLAFIRRMDKKSEEIFIYLDPPYLQKGADLYMNYYSKKDHENLSKNVHKMDKKWMVSYDNHDFILNLYGERRKLIYKLSQAASNRIGDEILIFSDQLDFSDSLQNLKSPSQVINTMHNRHYHP